MVTKYWCIKETLIKQTFFHARMDNLYSKKNHIAVQVNLIIMLSLGSTAADHVIGEIANEVTCYRC